MDKVHKNYLADVQSRISGAKTSQLAMAAPLESGSSSQSKSKAATPTDQKKPPEIKDLPNQKFGLLAGLLAVGALRPAFAIMSKFPWAVDAQPEIADLMLRVMKVSLSTLYESSFVTKERNPSFTQPRARYGTAGLCYPPPRKPLLTLWAPTPPSTSTNDFVFFFPEWTERVPICSSLDDLVDVIEPLMRFIGLHISRDPLFLTKFLRLGRSHLQSTVVVMFITRETLVLIVFSSGRYLSILRQRNLPANLIPSIRFAYFGSRYYDCICFRPFLSLEVMLCAPSRYGISSDNTRPRHGGGSMGNGSRRSTTPTQSCVSVKFKQTENPKEYFDAFLTTPSTRSLGPLQSWLTQTPAFSSRMRSIRSWPMTIWPMWSYKPCDMSRTWVLTSLFSLSWMLWPIQEKSE